MKKILILFMLPWAIYTSGEGQSDLSIKKKATTLKEIAFNNNPDEFSAYTKLLEEVRKDAKDYLSQKGSMQKLCSRKKFLAQFYIVWDQYKSRLFSDNDIKIWTENWHFVSLV